MVDATTLAAGQNDTTESPTGMNSHALGVYPSSRLRSSFLISSAFRYS